MGYRFPISFENLHPPDLCFFCKRRPAVEVEVVELYKTVQNATGFPGYVAKYATAKVAIPICKPCQQSHRESNRFANVFFGFSYAVAAVVISWSIHSEGHGWLISVVGGLVIGIPGAAIVGIPILAVAALCVFVWILIQSIFGWKSVPHDSAKNFPLYKALVERNWKDSLPKPKWDRELHETASKETVAKFHREAIEDALAITEEYANAVKTQFTK